MAVNCFIYEGNLGKDPELKMHGDVPFCTFTMAQTIRRKIKGRDTEDTMWAEVTVWGNNAKRHVKNLHKGRRVVVTGSLAIEDWTDRSGSPKYTVKIRANEVDYMDEPTRRGGDESGGESDAAQAGGDQARTTGANHNQPGEETADTGSGDTPW